MQDDGRAADRAGAAGARLEHARERELRGGADGPRRPPGRALRAWERRAQPRARVSVVAAHPPFSSAGVRPGSTPAGAPPPPSGATPTTVSPRTCTSA